MNSKRPAHISRMYTNSKPAGMPRETMPELRPPFEAMATDSKMDEMAS